MDDLVPSDDKAVSYVFGNKCRPFSSKQLRPNVPMIPLVRSHSPIHGLFDGVAPILTRTQTAQVVRPYTKASGKYLAHVQQHRSTLRAQRYDMFGGEGDWSRESM